MLFMLFVSLLLLLLPFIGQLFFVFCDIFRVQSFRVLYFCPPLLWSCMHTLMLITVMIPHIASPLLVSVSFQVILLFLGRARNNLLFLNLQPKQNIVLWHLLPNRLFGCVGYLRIWEFPFLIQFLYIVTIRVLFRLLTTLFLIIELSTLKSIVILLVIISSMTPLLCLLFLLLCRLQISLPICIPFLVFVFQLANSRCLYCRIMSLREDVKKYISFILFVKGKIIFLVQPIYNLFVFRLK